MWLSSFEGADNEISRPPRTPRQTHNPLWKGKRKQNLHQKSVHVSNSFKQFQYSAYGARSNRKSPNPGLITGPPYHSWSTYLVNNFDLPMYNEFRRLAIDEFFTRHVDYGFNALLSFYKSCLYSPRPIPQEVLSDLIALSRAPGFEHHSTVYRLLRSALDSKEMERSNKAKTSLCLNRDRQTVKNCRDRAT